MQSRRWLWLAAAALAMSACMAGCSKKQPDLAHVHGKVYFRDEPLRGGTIVFAPDTTKGGKGKIAHAEIQSDGSFTLTTAGETGAPVGWHRITVMGPDTSPGKPSLPRRYCDPELSGLSREVKKGVDNSIELKLGY